MGVFQIESRAQMQSLRRTRPRDAGRPHDPGRDRAPGADPRRRGQPLHRAPPAAARGPGLRRALRPPVARAGAARHARHDHLPGPGDRGARWPSPASRPGEAEGLRRAMSRKRSAAAIEAYHQRFVEGAARTHGVDEETAERVYYDDRRLLGLRLPQGPRRRVRAARLPVDLAARALRPGVPVRAAQRAADGLLRLRHARPRGPAARDPDAAPPTSTRARWSARWPPTARVRLGLGYVRGVRADEVAALVAARERGRARSARWPTSPRAPGRGRPSLEKLAWAGACDALAGVEAGADGANRARRAALWQLGVAAPGDARCARARSSRCRWSCPAPPALRPLAAVGVDGRRLRDDRADARRAPDGAAARAAAGGRGLHARPGDDAPRGPGGDRRPGRRAPAARDGEGDRVPAARGRVRDDQPDRPAATSTSATA